MSVSCLPSTAGNDAAVSDMPSLAICWMASAGKSGFASGNAQPWDSSALLPQHNWTA